MSTLAEQISKLEETIAQLEAQRAVLDAATAEVALQALRQQLADLRRQAALSPPQPPLAGERKLVTIMFADLSGFTALAEAMDPEAVRDLMNACFECLVPKVEKYEGTVDKFIGDGVMVLFGAPLTHENDPERALRAALEMREALKAFNAERNTDLGIHFGVNTGLVIAGGIGTPDKREYSVIGDAVNLATRLEELSERGEILVGPDTYRLSAPWFQFEPLEPAQVKGKAEPVPVYRLLGPRVVPGKVRGIAGLESPLVGRQAELGRLQGAMERLQAGRGGVVTLVGEAGLGKSRLVAEIKAQTIGEGAVATPPRWVEGHCLSYGASIAYLLWTSVTRELLNVTPEASPSVIRQALGEQIQALCPECADVAYPYLGHLLSLPLEAEVKASLREMEGEQLKQNTFQALQSLIQGAAQSRPLVIVCEDLHWADPTSLELLESLLPLTETLPLLIVCVFRPSHEHGRWRIKERAEQLAGHANIWLEPLSTADSDTLVSQLLAMENLPRQLKARILSHAEGNPFYVEEIVRALIDDGTLVRDEARDLWQATRDVADITIPDTLHGVLMARIDRLQVETKRILQMAAVIGRTFLYRVLAAIAQEERSLEEHLQVLQQEEMIRERAKLPELEYIFKHHLTQEAAYNGLLKKERVTFHRRVAQALEGLFPEWVEEQAGLLAHHWERAEEPEKAIAYLLRAGDQARLAYAHQEAIDYYQRALAFLKKEQDHEQAARTQIKLGLTFHAAFDFRQARQAHEEGFALWKRTGETPPAALVPAPHALRLAQPQPLSTLDPTLAFDAFSTSIIAQLFSGLVDLGLQMDIEPGIAHSWEVLEDGRRFVFHLRNDVVWSDGGPVTAGDFAYAWKRVLDPRIGSHNASLLYDIQGARLFHQGKANRQDVAVQAPDETTLIVQLDRPTGYFLQLLTHTTFYPVPRHAIEAHGEAWTDADQLVNNGPFNLEAWDRDGSIVLARNPHYYGRFKGNLERVEQILQADKQVLLALYQSGDLDVLPLSAALGHVRHRYAGEYISAPQLHTLYLGFNTSRPPFDDPRVRRAFAMAVDKETCANVVLGGYAAPAIGGFVPPGMPGHSEGIGLPYDPQQARRLLDQAGYAGQDLGDMAPINLLTHLVTQALGEHLLVQWQENLGVKASCESAELSPLLERLAKNPPHCFVAAWMADYPHPDNFLRVSSARRHTRWQHDAYEELVEKARGVTDQVEHLALYRQADTILVQEAAIVPLVHARFHLLVKPWVKKLPLTANRGEFWKDVIIEPH